MKKKVIVIGAGIGGLAVASLLAKDGFLVTVLEKNETIGGKVNFIEANGYKFDTGASLLTLPQTLNEVFSYCSKQMSDYLQLVQLEPICRYFWSDGTSIDIYQDTEKTKAEVEKLSKTDVVAFEKYLKDAKIKYEIAEKTFLAKSLNELPELFFSPRKYLIDFFKLSSLKTLDKHNRSYFKSAKLIQLFNRFATYNGSSPYKVPATFSLIPYVEFGFGAWYPIGGIYQIPKALANLATELGVKILTKTTVRQIIVENQKAIGIRTDDETIRADLVVSNADGVETYRRLLGIENKFTNREPSCSGFVIMLGVRKKFDQIAHHNIFFSDDYKAEFDSIFKDKLPAKDPTIYVCASSRTDHTQAPENCENLFILVNAPYLTENFNWEEHKKRYRDLIIQKLEGFGFEGLSKAIEFEEIITPADFAEKTFSNKGSIYGISSNGIFSAFLRIPNKCREIKNLYFVGGAAHPGGGIPLVLLSAKMTARLIAKSN
ncbi:MAG: phytoene desaturase family protein [Pyrinomonadaceae bacterium]|nr:phytoene desaturase family protein [Pyrinomonadaceae bacterium]MCX7640077.1 phytoene desaturase family protein [Pyrinomonadaceae bacterium]MDW8304249.1 phytoene desaturase family protein [Acidobacteriota bacterium]